MKNTMTNGPNTGATLSCSNTSIHGADAQHNTHDNASGTGGQNSAG